VLLGDRDEEEREVASATGREGEERAEADGSDTIVSGAPVRVPMIIGRGRWRALKLQIDSATKAESKDTIINLVFGLLDLPIHPTHAFISKA
jgi:hypothetical protein